MKKLLLVIAALMAAVYFWLVGKYTVEYFWSPSWDRYHETK